MERASNFLLGEQFAAFLNFGGAGYLARSHDFTMTQTYRIRMFPNYHRVAEPISGMPPALIFIILAPSGTLSSAGFPSVVTRPRISVLSSSTALVGVSFDEGD